MLGRILGLNRSKCILVRLYSLYCVCYETVDSWAMCGMILSIILFYYDALQHNEFVLIWLLCESQSHVNYHRNQYFDKDFICEAYEYTPIYCL